MVDFPDPTNFNIGKLYTLSFYALLEKRLAASGEACQVVRDLFYAPAAVRQLGAIAAELMEADGCIRAATFRDRTGLGRKRAIQVLEYFDRVGYTRKLGRGHDEQHRIRGDLAVN